MKQNNLRNNSASSNEIKSSESISSNNSSDSSSDNESTSSVEEENEDRPNRTGGRVKNFLKNLLHLTKRNSKSTNNLSDNNNKKQEQINSRNKPAKTQATPVQRLQQSQSFIVRGDSAKLRQPANIVEETDLKHPFLTVKNRDSNLFEDYRKTCIKTPDQFRL